MTAAPSAARGDPVTRAWNDALDVTVLAPTHSVAVASMDDVRFDGERAEIEMRLWCGSLCGVFLTYEAVLGSAGWEILGTTGPIAMS